MSSLLLVLGQISCIILIIVLLVATVVFILDARRPVEEWAYHSEAFFGSIAADERERPQTMAGCAAFTLIAAILLLGIGIAVF